MNGLSWRRIGLVALAAGVVGAGWFVAMSADTYRIGFPLDDAWIHQTYARNLAAAGEWAFTPGERSGGSTSPLWTVLLSVGHLVGLDPRVWAFTLGTVALVAAGSLGGLWLRNRSGSTGWVVLLGTLVLGLEWHLLWSSVSGMEVILVAALVVAVIAATARPGMRPEVIGFLIGLGIWIRPDAVTLIVIPGVVLLARSDRTIGTRATDLARLALGVGLPLVVYLLFNLSTAGTIWPSTFYSKQTEYGALTASPFLERFLRLAREPLIGPGLLLLPGAVFSVVDAARRRRWVNLAAATWALAYLLLYAVRLPVTYQHGRYQIPVVPIVLLLGWEGIGRLAAKAPTPRLALLLKGWAAAVALTAIGFVGLGGRAYGLDVAIIETEMVETAEWIERNTQIEALIAAHDIGALGYFGGREVLDLAGLTDPEVIPIVRDEPALAGLLFRSGTDYLMTFPGWYPELTACGNLVYTSEGRFSPAAGGENMAVYRWPVVPAEGCMLYSP